MRRSWLLIAILTGLTAVAVLGVVGSGAWFTSIATGSGNQARTDTLAVAIAADDGSSAFVPVSASLLPGDPPVRAVFSVNKTGSIPPKYWVAFRQALGSSSPALAGQTLVTLERDMNNGVGTPNWVVIMPVMPLGALLSLPAEPPMAPQQFSGSEGRHVLRVSLELPATADNTAQGLTQDFDVKIVATQPGVAPFPHVP